MNQPAHSGLRYQDIAKHTLFIMWSVVWKKYWVKIAVIIMELFKCRQNFTLLSTLGHRNYPIFYQLKNQIITF